MVLPSWLSHLFCAYWCIEEIRPFLRKLLLISTAKFPYSLYFLIHRGLGQEQVHLLVICVINYNDLFGFG